MPARIAFTLRFLATLAYFQAGVSALLLASALILNLPAYAVLSTVCFFSAGALLALHHRTQVKAEEILGYRKTER